MFTGIIEANGKIKDIQSENSNIHFTIESDISNALKIDQSIAHNGVCLTVIEQNENWHKVTAIQETLDKTNLNEWKVGDLVNLERCMQMNGRLDGHIVQGHVDTIGKIENIQNANGSWVFTINYNADDVTVEKGSITINGTSLTVVNSKNHSFDVHIIPYTFEHTNFHQLKIGQKVNLEFDIIGKYVKRLLAKSSH
jgi:riboflavin synthase